MPALLRRRPAWRVLTTEIIFTTRTGDPVSLDLQALETSFDLIAPRGDELMDTLTLILHWSESLRQTRGGSVFQVEVVKRWTLHPDCAVCSVTG